ncbi:hypothetical protein [Brunnivagina elsteri]|nr:hypothetical protein [Calothrix elsteri]
MAHKLNPQPVAIVRSLWASAFFAYTSYRQARSPAHIFGSILLV